MYLFCFLSGGYTVGPKPLIDLLRQRSRPYLFSNALPPPVVGSATRAVELLLASNEIAQSMTAKTMRYVLFLRTVEVFYVFSVVYIIKPIDLSVAILISYIGCPALSDKVYTAYNWFY